MRNKATWTPAEKRPRTPGACQVQTPDTKCGCCWEEADFRDGGWWRYGVYGTLKVRQAVTVTHWRRPSNTTDEPRRKASDSI